MPSFFENLLGLNQGEPLIDAANKNNAIVTQYNTNANQFLDNAKNEAGGYYGTQGELTRPLSGAVSLYSDALGLNGADGSQRVNDAFQTSPGYEFTLNQGLDALARKASSMGSYQSGGTGQDFINYGTGLANQEYGNWMDRLAGGAGTYISGQTGALDNLANLATGIGTQKVGVAGDYASGLMAANNQAASGQQTNNQGVGNLGGSLFNLAGKAIGATTGFGGF